MTYLGTRPILQDELRQYELHHRARIAIKPGITGMWQVSGRSDITDFEEVVRLDTEYISKIQTWKNGCRKLEFLGSSCIYPRMAPQPMKEECFSIYSVICNTHSYNNSQILLHSMKYISLFPYNAGTLILR